MSVIFSANEKELTVIGKKMCNGPDPYIKINVDLDYMLCFDGIDQIKIKFSPNLMVRVTQPAFLSPVNLIDVYVGNKEVFTLSYQKKQFKEVLKFVSVLEENEILVAINKCTDTYIGHDYERGCLHLLKDGSLEFVIESKRINIQPSEVQSVNVQSGLIYLVGNNGQKLEKNKESISMLVTKSKFKPVIEQFMENLRVAGYKVIREKW